MWVCVYRNGFLRQSVCVKSVEKRRSSGCMRAVTCLPVERMCLRGKETSLTLGKDATRKTQQGLDGVLASELAWQGKLTVFLICVVYLLAAKLDTAPKLVFCIFIECR